VSVREGRWEKAADAYATGEHRSGRDLELVVQFAAPRGSERVLDIGAGAGHTGLALAPHVRSVVVTDPVEGMLAAARRVFEQAGVRNGEFLRATAERLPFEAASFDIVTSRLAAHHFDDVALAMREVARVLRPGGRFVFVDTLAPEDPESAAFQDAVERLRDPTHRRIYTSAEWIASCERAGLAIRQVDEVHKAHDFEPWLERGGEDADTMALVRQRFLQAPPAAVRDLQIVIDDGRVRSFTDRKLVLGAQRSG
jgi:ubiquinone/menaquinone biosynthesis C-methylase UbiE